MSSIASEQYEGNQKDFMFSVFLYLDSTRTLRYWVSLKPGNIITNS